MPIVFFVIYILISKLPFLINNVDSELYPKIQTVGIILGINLLINPLWGIPDALLTGTNQGYLSTWIKTIGLIISNFLPDIS